MRKREFIQALLQACLTLLALTTVFCSQIPAQTTNQQFSGTFIATGQVSGPVPSGATCVWNETWTQTLTVYLGGSNPHLSLTGPRVSVPVDPTQCAPGNFFHNYQNIPVTVAGSSISATIGTFTAGFVSISITGQVNQTSGTLQGTLQGIIPPPSMSTVQGSFTLQQVTTGQLAVTPSGIDFGSVPPNQSRSRRFVIQNTGPQGTVLVGSVSSPSSPFSVTQGNGSFSLPSGASTTVDIAFQPSTAGSFTDTVAISSNDPAAPSVAVPLSGSEDNLMTVTVWTNAFIPYPSFGPLILLPQVFLLLDPSVTVSATLIDAAGDGRSFSDQPSASFRNQWLQSFDATTLTSNCAAPCLGGVGPSHLLYRPTGAVIATETAPNTGVLVGQPQQVGSTVLVHMSGGAEFPFFVNAITKPLVPQINVDVTFIIDLANRTCQLVGTYGGFPAFEAYVQGNNDSPLPLLQSNVGPEIAWPFLIQGLYLPNLYSVAGPPVPF